VIAVADNLAADAAAIAWQRRSRYLSFASYVGTVALTVFVLFPALDLPHRDLRIPFEYKGGDGLAVLAGAKTIIETGWYYYSPSLGAPGTGEFLDYPQSDLFHFAILKLFCLFTSSPAVAVNLFFLAGFPLAAVAAMFALRRLGVSRPLGMIGGALYALQPYHFVRGEMHLFLANYAMVPLALLVAIALAAGVDLRLWGPGARAGPRRRMVVAMVIVAAVACSGVYYGFFAAFMLAVGGVLGAIRIRSFGRLIAPAILLGVAVLTLAANLLPTVIYTHFHGVDRDIAERRPNEADLFSLKITYLLLPNMAHRSPAMQKLFDAYDSTQHAEYGESKRAAIGWLAGFGFVVLIGVVLLRAIGVEVSQPLGYLAALNLAAVLLGTQSGLGSLFSYFVSASLRSYARISIFIAFFSIATVMILLGRLLDPILNRPGRRAGAFAVLCVLMGLTLYDQLPMPEMDPPRIADTWNSDDDFVKQIEHSVPAGSMIFQLPYDPFPESPPIEELRDYDLFRGYIHSTTLRWSYGAMRGRETDQWLKQVSQLTPQPLVDALRQRGFAGIYLDRHAYRDPTRLEKALRAATGSDGFASADARLVFFPIRPPPAS
jgi:phosphoglycerol transferase